MKKECTIEGCTKIDQLRRGWCHAHYERWRTTGSVGSPIIASYGQSCQVDDCANQHVGLGFCNKHLGRFHKHSDPTIVKYYRPSWDDPSQHPRWKSDIDSYGLMHLRVRRQNGHANTYECVDCDQQAAEWSYTGDDPNEQIDQNGKVFSVDFDRYVPRCVLCHRRYDSRRRSSA